MISQVRLSWTLYTSSLIFQIHRSAIATPGLSPLGRGGYILLSPSRLVTTAPGGIGVLCAFPYFAFISTADIYCPACAKYPPRSRPLMRPCYPLASPSRHFRSASPQGHDISKHVYRSLNKTQADKHVKRLQNLFNGRLACSPVVFFLPMSM